MSAALVRDVSRAREHLHRLFDGLEGFVALGMGFGGYFDGDSYKFPDRQFQEGFWLWPEHEDHLLAKVAEHVAKADIYICPLLRRTRSRKAGTGALGQFAWADIDGHAPPGWERAILGPSSFVVGSGRGQHPYIALPEPIAADELEDLNQRIARALDADSGWSETKYLRLCGTLNHKPRARGGESASVDFLEVVTGERDWSIEELRELLPAGGAKGLVTANGDTPTIEAREPEHIPEHLLVRRDEEVGDHPGRQSFWFVAACIDAGLSDEETMWLALEHKPTTAKFGNERPEDDRRAKEVARSIRKVRPDPTAPDAQPFPDSETVSEKVEEDASQPARGDADTEPFPPFPAVRETVVGNGSGSAEPADPVELLFQSAADFAAVDEPNAETILGLGGDDAAFVAGGTVVMFGKGGGGKTTLVIDIACHLATGTDWHGLKVPKSQVVAVVENDGPRGRFRRKVRAKLAAWEGSEGDDPGDNLQFLIQPWGQLKLSREDHRAALASYINERKVDALIAGPIVSLGMIGGGTPDEVAAFEAHLQSLRDRLERPLLIILLHHTNQRGQISGAWDRVPDTLMFVVNTGRGTRLTWQKARDSSSLHASAWKLKWAEGMSFELDDTPEQTEEDIEQAILASVSANPGGNWSIVADKERVKGNTKAKAAVRDRLIAEGRLLNRGKGQAFALWIPDEVDDLDEDEQAEDDAVDTAAEPTVDPSRIVGTCGNCGNPIIRGTGNTATKCGICAKANITYSDGGIS